MKKTVLFLLTVLLLASCSNKPKVSLDESGKIIKEWKITHNSALPAVLKDFVERQSAEKSSNSREAEGESIKVRKARDMGLLPDKSKGELMSVKLIPSGKVRFLLAEYFSAPDKEYISDLFLVASAGKLEYLLEGGTNEGSVKIINPGKDAPDLAVVESFGGGNSVRRTFYAINVEGGLDKPVLELKVWQEGGFGFSDVERDGVDEATVTTNANVPADLLKLIGGEEEDWKKTILAKTEFYKLKKNRFVSMGEYYH